MRQRGEKAEEMRPYCTVGKAYEIADETMFELLIAQTIADEQGWREIHDEAARDAARWCLCRGMAIAERGRIMLIDPPATWSDDE